MDDYSSPDRYFESPDAGTAEKIPEKPDKKKGSRAGFAVGLILIVFAVVGIVFTVISVSRFISAEKDEKLSKQLAEYDPFLLPVAAVDPDGFDDISGAAMDELINIAVWSIIGDDLDPAGFEYSDDELLIPVERVEAAFIEYFGTQRVIEHRTVEGYGYEFKYDSARGVYCLPLTTIAPSYTPKVTAVETKGGATVITCGLINANVWMQDAETGALMSPEPDKYLKVTLREFGGVRYISAIQSSGTPETALPNANYGDYFTTQPAETTTEEPESETIVITRN